MSDGNNTKEAYTERIRPTACGMCGDKNANDNAKDNDNNPLTSLARHHLLWDLPLLLLGVGDVLLLPRSGTRLDLERGLVRHVVPDRELALRVRLGNVTEEKKKGGGGWNKWKT